MKKLSLTLFLLTILVGMAESLCCRCNGGWPCKGCNIFCCNCKDDSDIALESCQKERNCQSPSLIAISAFRHFGNLVGKRKRSADIEEFSALNVIVGRSLQQKLCSTGPVELRLLTFFRLAQAYIWTKRKGFYQSCTRKFLLYTLNFAIE